MQLYAPSTLSMTRAYERVVVLCAGVLPLIVLAYLELFQNPSLRFSNHAFHEIAIAIAILQTGFVAYVAGRCYLSSGEPLQRWLTLAFLGFGVVYAPHGVFTMLGDQYLWLFIVYGPVSRLVMAAFILIGVLTFGEASHSPEERRRKSFWLSMLGGLLIVDLVAGYVALTWPESQILNEICSSVADALALPILSSPMQLFRLLAEVGALLLSLTSAAIILGRQSKSSLMTLTAFALTYSAQASLVFVFAKPWSHLWWLAHAISAAGFTILSYGVIRAFHTTRAFANVFNQEEVMRQLAEAKNRAETLADQLLKANENLEVLASTDSLTGLANRRHFMERAEAELARALRSGKPLTVLALDLDHFKHINDDYGHAVGDLVLMRFGRVATAQLRSSDLIGRLGGEEFVILLPDSALAPAIEVAERIRRAVEAERVETVQGEVLMTVSIGLAEFDAMHTHRLPELLELADKRMYAAKMAGRNCVVSQS